ncbi:unnamed protein product [Arctia plantaginis]|uniref:CHK kinase-like domain-containing protein n=1 Tax=Arctia plantaginis TaxID=874455 RepID=A0A8S0YN19_ARCPL|nr:unnamed protein product [Arctia plantaginis]
MAHDKITKALKNILNNVNYTNYNLKIEEISTGGANYTSNLFKVEVVPEDDKPTLHLFVKVACPSVKLRSTLDEWKIYTTEQLFYTRLLKTYKALENEHRVPSEERLHSCKYYGSSLVVLEEMIVLEDLTASNWLAYDRLKSIDWPYAKAAISQLAKFHALSFAYGESNPDEFNRVLDELKTQMNHESLATFVENAKSVALQKVKSERKNLLKEYLKDFEAKIKKVNEPSSHNAITHGVFRPSNLMHKTKEDGSMEVIIVDMQTLQGASPVADLLYFIFTGSDKEFRAEYYDKLIDHYYSELEAAMKRLHMDPEKIYSRAVFDQEFKEKLPLGLTIAVFALPVVTVSPDKAPKVDEDMELSAFSAETASDLYVERLNGVVDDFVKWGLLK